MPTPTNAVISELATRLRDPFNNAYPRSTILQVLTLAQRVAIAHLKLAVQAVTFTPAFPLAAINRWSDNAIGPVMSVEAISQEGRLLDRVPWRDLVHQDPKWIINLGRRYEAFATIGKSLYVLIPTVNPAPQLVASLVLVPPDPTDSVTPLNVPDAAVALVRDITETVMLAHGRRFDSASGPTLRVANLIEAFKARQRYLDIAGQG